MVRAGLQTTQDRSALVLTVYDTEEELDLESISAMSLRDFAELYTVLTLKYSSKGIYDASCGQIIVSTCCDCDPSLDVHVEYRMLCCI